MQCPYCGQANNENYRFCRNCGKPRPPATPPDAVPPGQSPVPSTVKASLPIDGQPPVIPGQYQQPYQPGQYDQTMQAPQPGQSYPGVQGQTPNAPYPTPAMPQMGAQPYPMPETPQPYPTAAQTPYSASPAKTGLRRPKLVMFILLGVLLVLVLAVVGVFAILKPAISLPFLSGKYLSIMIPNQDGGNNLYLLKVGQDLKDGALLAEQVDSAELALLAVNKSKADIQIAAAPFTAPDQNNFGSFVPGSKAFYYWYADDGGISINRIDVGDEKGDEILGAESSPVTGIVSGAAKVITLVENLSEETRCYAAKPGEAADLMGEGSDCQVSIDGSTMLVSDLKDGALTVTAVKTADGKDTELLSDEAGAREPRLSWDGSQVAYIQEEDAAERVIVLDVDKEETIVEGDDQIKINSLAFAPRSNSLFYIAEGEDGELTLYLLDKDGSKEVAVASSLEAKFSRDGNYLIYLLSKGEGKSTLYSYNVKDESEEKITSSNDLADLVLSFPEIVLIKEQSDGDITLSSASIDGGDLLELYQDKDVELEDVLWQPGGDTLYLLLRGADDLHSLFVTSIDQEDGSKLLDGWAEIKLLNRSLNGKKLVFTGHQKAGDPLALYVIDQEEDAEPVQLDDEIQDVTNAVFSGNGKDIYYTTITGSNPADIEVRWVDAAGEESPEVEYEGASLVDTQWSRVQPFEKFDWGTTIAASSEGKVSPAKECAKTLDLTIGSASLDTIGGGDKNCYRFPAASNQAYSINITSDSDFDPMLSALDQNGNLLANDDDSGPGVDPVVNITSPMTGTMTAEVMVKAAKSGDYHILVREGQSDLAFDNATLLLVGGGDASTESSNGVRTRGTITQANPVFIRSYNYPTYGNVYYFNGQAGQKIQIDVFAHSLGSEIVPRVLVFDPNEAALEEEDVLVSGNQDYSFLYTLKTNGRHYILVQDNTDRYGSEDKFFYEVTLSNRD